MKLLNFLVVYNRTKNSPTFSHLLKQMLSVLWHIHCLPTLPFITLLACNVCIPHICAYVLVFNDLFS